MNKVYPSAKAALEDIVKDGQTFAVGTHTELLSHSPLYARLASLQFTSASLQLA